MKIKKSIDKRVERKALVIFFLLYGAFIGTMVGSFLLVHHIRAGVIVAVLGVAAYFAFPKFMRLVKNSIVSELAHKRLNLIRRRALLLNRKKRKILIEDMRVAMAYLNGNTSKEKPYKGLYEKNDRAIISLDNRILKYDYEEELLLKLLDKIYT
ncbi:MAG TPA: hypothetical protein VG621_03470 [Candidatus Paceibacterota bacterium]|nr:hypothetical protein [Candidatus Paceibacterota bacterium]